MSETQTSSEAFAVITGAAGSIGQSLVETFSVAGYQVVAVDLHRPTGDCPCDHFLQADLQLFARDEDYAAKQLDEIRKILSGGTLAVFVNNAATQRLNPVSRLSREQWTASLQVNAMAPFFWIQGLLQELAQAGGSVINIGSIHSRLTKQDFTAYAASKAALESLTRSLAIELGEKVKINTIAPAAIDTPMLRAGFAGNAGKIEALRACHPTGSIGSPAEVAKLALALAQNDLPFLNGSTINLDGGISGRLYDPD